MRRSSWTGRVLLMSAFAIAAASCGRLTQAGGSAPIPGPTLTPGPSPSSAPTPGCVGSSLQILADPVENVPFDVVWDMGLKNVGTSTCSVQGYPTIGIHDATGQAIRVDITRGTDLYGVATPTEVVVLQPGEIGGFWLENDLSAPPNPPCPAIPGSAALDVTPAGSGSPASIQRFPLRFSCGLVVYPFHAGYTWPPGTSTATPGEMPSPAMTSSP